MSDLLSIGASGVRAYNTALAAIGENVSNADTPGYTRRTVTLAQTRGAASTVYYSNYAGFAGVRVTSIGRASNDYQANAARGASSDAGAAAARLAWLSSAQTALGDDATGIGQSATAVFNAATTLAANPGGTSGRQAFLTSLDQLGSAFRATAGQLATVAEGIAGSASTTVDSVNASLDQLGKVNAQLRTTQKGSEAQATLLDQRDQLLATISGDIGIDVSYGSDGGATVKVADGGPTLVADGAVSHLTLRADTAGQLTLAVQGDGGATAIGNAGGTLGGLVDSAATVAARRQQLDTMAAGFGSALATWQQAGTKPDGTAGTLLLTGTTAATIGLASGVGVADIAAAKNGAANGNLLALAADVRAGTGIETRWNGIVTDQGQLVASATTESKSASARSDTATSALAATTGVDLDTEAAELVRYQQAYNGSAKVIQVARETLQSILDII